MALMAPPQAPSLEVTAPDDDMEISSDAGRVEHDNDIDLVDDDDDIDYMLEDTRSEQGQPRIDEMPDAARDDIMYDDLDEITYGEDDMHDDVPVPDEHLTDVSEFHHDPGFGQFAQPQASEEQTTPTQIHASSSFDATIASGHQAAESDALIETVDYVEQSYNDPTPTANADPAPTEPDAPVSELQTNEQEDVREPGGAITTQSDAQGEEVLASYDGLDAPFDETSNTEQLSETTNPTSHDVPEPALNDDEYIDTTPQHQLNSPKRTEQQESAISLQQEEPISLLSQDKAEAPASPKQAINNDLEEVQDSEEGARSFHTTIVDYEGAHISLFPPMQDDDADMFLLKDPTLADKTLVDLFRACRQVLGESIDDDLELEIYSEDLDLTISEDSIHCMTTSFSQLVDVYVTLSQQDGVEHPEPFFISLIKKSRWSSRLSALYVAADESKGLSAMQIEPYAEDYTGAKDDYEDENSEEEDVTPAQSSTESRLEGGMTEGQNSAVATTTTITTTTDTEPAEDEIHPLNDDSANADELTEEGKDENEENDMPAPAENDQFDFVEQDSIETVPEALAEDDSLDQIGGVENGDDESSGSSTVQGENDPPQSSQYSSSDDFDDDDDGWLMEDEDTVHDGTPEHQLHSLLGEEALTKSASDINAEKEASALVDDGEWREVDEQTHQDESYPDSYNDDGQFENPEAAAQNQDQVGNEDVQHDDDRGLEEVPHLDEASEQIAENEWATFDDELDFDLGGEEQHVDDATPPAPEHPASSGTFRVPDDSAEEEDEDSITYDDDELDLPAQPKPDAVQARSTSQSPLGKRSRDDGEDGGDDGSDQESKRVKSQ